MAADVATERPPRCLQASLQALTSPAWRSCCCAWRESWTFTVYTCGASTPASIWFLPTWLQVCLSVVKRITASITQDVMEAVFVPTISLLKNQKEKKISDFVIFFSKTLFFNTDFTANRNDLVMIYHVKSFWCWELKEKASNIKSPPPPDEEADVQFVLAEATRLLRSQFGFSDVTVQVERGNLDWPVTSTPSSVSWIKTNWYLPLWKPIYVTVRTFNL